LRRTLVRKQIIDQLTKSAHRNIEKHIGLLLLCETMCLCYYVIQKNHILLKYLIETPEYA